MSKYSFSHHGTIGSLVEKIEPQTESDPYAIHFQMMAMLGSIYGRRSYFCVEATKHYPNLFLCLVGKSSRARKGTSFDIVEDVIKKISPEWQQKCIASGLSTGEGLLERLRDTKVITQNGVRQEVPVSHHDKRLLVKESEFASVLKLQTRTGNILSQILRNAWDKGEFEIMTKADPIKIKDSHISIIGNITVSELNKELSQVDLYNGFANRFMWLHVERSKLLPEGKSIDLSMLDQEVERLRVSVESVQDRMLRRDADASEAWKEIYQYFNKEHEFSDLTSRGEAYVMRLALVYSLVRCGEAINRTDLMNAFELWLYLEKRYSTIFGKDDDVDYACEKIETHFFNLDPGVTVTKTQLFDIFHRNIKGDKLDKALARLEERSYIEKIEHSDGVRTQIVWSKRGYE